MSENRRLNSWKEIAAYAGRDIRTVTRWAKTQGLPVRRVPGLRSVFAYTDEIDAWLAGGGGQTEIDDPSEAAKDERRPWVGRAAVTGAAVSLVAIVAVLTAPRLLTRPVTLVSVEEHGRDLVGMASPSRVAWVHTFPHPIRIAEPRQDRIALTDMTGDGLDDLVVAVTTRLPPVTAGPQDSEAVHGFSNAGRLLWSQELRDVLRFGGEEFQRPYYTSALRPFRAAGGWRLMWLAHHHTWWPSIATVLDATGQRIATFSHPGWLTNAAPLGEGVMLVTGVNNAFDADVVAILDDRSWPGTSPPSGVRAFDCAACPAGRPLIYFVLPRSEVNRATQSGPLPAYLHIFPTSIEVRFHETSIPPANAEVIYELTRDLRLRRVRHSDTYWGFHRRLEKDGLLGHTVDECPERRGHAVRIWERGQGWTALRVPPT